PIPTPLPSTTLFPSYLAGRDDERLADLNAALTDPAIDAVWCIRGGNGMNRIVQRVDFDGFLRNPKPVIGYSDITVLLLALWQRTDRKSTRLNSSHVK